jgi:hypothetical protein
MGRVLPARSISRAALIGVATDFAVARTVLEKSDRTSWQINLAI